MISHLLYCRGYRSAGEIRTFFTQGPISHDPFLLPDMERAVERIAQAVDRSETVAVYGDFDCDGITSAAALVSTLKGLALNPIALIPDREDGHGLTPEGLAALADQRVSLVITADCGITAIEEVRVARGMGMDVIVTDHHEPRIDGSLPDCPAVDPKRRDSEYPCRFICGVGVAYKLAQALAARLPAAPDPELLLDLVALGTVADVVPLLDENRSLVLQGLARLRDTERPGLLALFEAAGIDRSRIDPVAIGFYVAPRINAANRMATPQLAYDLITASDPDRAAKLAAQLSDHNQRRQLLVAKKFEMIAEQIGDPASIAEEVQARGRPPLLMIVGDWPAGISGLLASKLVETYGLPAFVGSDTGTGIVSVSARGVPNVRIDELLERSESALPGGIFLGYGGHAGAGGFRVDRERLAQARQLLEEQGYRQIPIDEIGAVLPIDAEVSLRSLTLDAARRVRTLAPFGIGFTEPLFLARNVVLKRRSHLGNGKHARISVQQGSARMDGIIFNAPEQFAEIALETKLDTVFHFQLNEWQGLLKPELCIRDWRVASL
jgi:single-stranded-DNA-specific exonuclease